METGSENEGQASEEIPVNSIRWHYRLFPWIFPLLVVIGGIIVLYGRVRIPVKIKKLYGLSYVSGIASILGLLVAIILPFIDTTDPSPDLVKYRYIKNIEPATLDSMVKAIGIEPDEGDRNRKLYKWLEQYEATEKALIDLGNTTKVARSDVRSAHESLQRGDINDAARKIENGFSLVNKELKTYEEHLQSVTEKQLALKIVSAKFASVAGDIDMLKGRYRHAENKFRDAIKVLPQGNLLFRARLHRKQGLAYLELGEFKNSQEALDKALDQLHNSKTAQEKERIEILINLALLNQQQGDYSQAEERIVEAQGRLEVLPDSDDEIRSLKAEIENDLGVLWLNQGYPNEAFDVLHSALSTRKSLAAESGSGLNIATWQLSITYNNLGLACQDKAHCTFAEKYYKAAIETLGGNSKHPDLAQPFNNLATLYREQGRYEDAEDYYNRAIRILTTNFGPEQTHLYFSYLYDGLALVHECQEHFENAKHFYRDALKIREEALPTNHTDHILIAESQVNLANLYWRQGHLEKAEELFTKAQAMAEKLRNKSGSQQLTHILELCKDFTRFGRFRNVTPPSRCSATDEPAPTSK